MLADRIFNIINGSLYLGAQPKIVACHLLVFAVEVLHKLLP